MYYWKQGMPTWRLWGQTPDERIVERPAPQPSPDRGEIAITYETHPAGCYGSTFGDSLPEGFPEGIPCTSVRHAANPYIRTIARRYRLPPEFEATVIGLADNESGAEFYRPANSFDPRPIAERPAGKSRITAYGVYNWNKGAWAGLAERKSYLAEGANAPSMPEEFEDQWPWQATPYQQIAWPIDRYAKIFATILADGGTPLDAAMGIRVWHSGSGRFRTYRRLIKQGGHMPEMWPGMRSSSPDWYDEHTPNHYNDLVEWLQASS